MKKIVQVDGNPLNDRRKKDGALRLMLNDDERKALKNIRASNEIIAMLVAQGMDIKTVAEKNNLDPRELSSMLLSDRKIGGRNLMIDGILEKVLDLEHGMKRQQVADSFFLTPRQLHYLMISDDFKERYAAAFIEVRGDPIISAVQQGIVEDLLPIAYRQLQAALTEAPWSVRLNAVDKVMKMAGVQNVRPLANDRDEAARFLASHNITVTVEPTIPKEYKDAVNALEIVEGEVKELVAPIESN